MKFNIKKTHIIIIALGIIFNFLGAFHSNLWFDEAYSVGITDKSFIDIWKIGGNDVHPVLYYWILHIIGLLTNWSIMAYRIFSAICISILGILGFTHIRKDFGEKVGLWFSFFSYFLPTVCLYATEIRMYSLAIVFVTILAIYGYRLAKGNSENNEEQKNNSWKNWIIFGVFSLLSIYTHYYGLMAAGIINCILLFYLIKQKQKTSIIKLLASGTIQLIAYVPWLMYFLTQLKQVSGGFWIGFTFPETLMEILSSQFIGNLKYIIGFIASIIIYAYFGYRVYKSKKNKEECMPGVLAISIYASVILAAIIVTVALGTSIVYYRYLFVITGLYIFFMSYFIGKEKNKYIISLVVVLTLGLSIWCNYKQITEVYDKSNMIQITYLKENVKQDDIFVFDESNFGTGSVVALNFTNHKQIYYNPSNWHIEKAYAAFGEQLQVYTNLDYLEQCTGRVWVIDNENKDLYNKVFNTEDFKVVSEKLIKTKYENYVYNFVLVERVK